MKQVIAIISVIIVISSVIVCACLKMSRKMDREEQHRGADSEKSRW